jgi:hypothetical protein
MVLPENCAHLTHQIGHFVLILACLFLYNCSSQSDSPWFPEEPDGSDCQRSSEQEAALPALKRILFGLQRDGFSSLTWNHVHAQGLKLLLEDIQTFVEREDGNNAGIKRRKA